VTERVALKVARLEGSGDSERAYTLATEAFREELEKVAISEGRVAARAASGREGPGAGAEKPGGDTQPGRRVGRGRTEVDLVVEPVEGLQLLVKGQEGSISAVVAAPRGSMLRTPDMYMSKLIVGPGARGAIDIDAPVSRTSRP
jgi:fructose-1,6-bisphosphatase II